MRGSVQNQCFFLLQRKRVLCFQKRYSRLVLGYTYQRKVKPYDIAQPFTCTTYSYCIGIQVRNEGEQDDRKVINQKSEPLGHKNIIKRTFILFSPFMNEIEALVFIQPPTYR